MGKKRAYTVVDSLTTMVIEKEREWARSNPPTILPSLDFILILAGWDCHTAENQLRLSLQGRTLKEPPEDRLPGCHHCP